jgi:hypothetical protein
MHHGFLKLSLCATVKLFLKHHTSNFSNIKPDPLKGRVLSCSNENMCGESSCQEDNSWMVTPAPASSPQPQPQPQHVKISLDWLQRWIAVWNLWQFLAGLGIGTGVRAGLKAYTSISGTWITPIWLLASAAAMAFLMYWSKRKSSRSQSLPLGSGAQIVVQGMGLEENLKHVEDYYKKHSGQYMEEIQAHFQRMAAHFVDPIERERFLIRTISNGALAVLHDDVWRYIYRSQIDLLQDLNIQAMTLEQIKPYYDAAALANPDTYKQYSFELWLAFMRGKLLIVQDGNVVQITVRGKDFLRFLVQDSLPIKLKLN